MATSSPLVFQVRRRDPVLVAPARPTRHEFKPLSDLDDNIFFRHHAEGLLLFANEPSMEGRDPVSVIRDALAELLVYYYPIAGRLRELPESGKLVVECTGEGVLFVEADADVRLDQFGDDPHPPFPCIDELLHIVEGSDAFLHAPLFLINNNNNNNNIPIFPPRQSLGGPDVTRLKCGGFVLATRHNHAMLDGYGGALFLSSLGEMARGADAPTVLPVWERERLTARVPPRVTHAHPDLEFEGRVTPPFPPDAELRSFFFGDKEILALRSRLPPELRGISTRFELITACVWRSRAIALRLDADEPAIVIFPFNARGKCHPPLPTGYYGIAIVPEVTGCTAGELCGRPLAHALRLVRKAKASVTGGYLQSLLDFASANGSPKMTAPPFSVTDVKFSGPGFEEVDFGWGKSVVIAPPYTHGVMACFLYRYRSSKGEDGVMAMVCLPAPVMERFAAEIEGITTVPSGSTTIASRITSAL